MVFLLFYTVSYSFLFCISCKKNLRKREEKQSFVTLKNKGIKGIW